MKDDYKILKIICRKICGKYKIDDYEDVFHNAIHKFLESGEDYHFYRLVNYIKYTAYDHRNIQYTRRNKNMSRVISLSDIVLMSYQYEYLFNSLSFDPEYQFVEIEDKNLYKYLLGIKSQNDGYYRIVKEIYRNRGSKAKLHKVKRQRTYYTYLPKIQLFASEFIKKAHHSDGLFRF